MNFYKESSDIAKQLEKIDKLRCDVWRMWRYAKTQKILVLCGYNNIFDVRAYILFRGVSHIFLCQWLKNAKFEIDYSKGQSVISDTAKSECKNKFLVISDGKEQIQYVVCEEIAFFDASQEIPM